MTAKRAEGKCKHRVRPPKDQPEPLTVRLKLDRYQQSKAEMEGMFTLDGTPEDLTRAVLRPMRTVHDPDA